MPGIGRAATLYRAGKWPEDQLQLDRGRKWYFPGCLFRMLEEAGPPIITFSPSYSETAPHPHVPENPDDP